MSEQASEATVDQAEAGTGTKTGTAVMTITTEVAEYQELVDGLMAMYQRCHNVVYDLKTVAGDKQARSDRKQLVSARTALERRRVELNAKDRATIAERIALRDSEALRLEGYVRALEQPISEQIAADEARREQERAARMKAEEDRCNAHRARINEISAVAVRAAGLSSAEIESKHALVTRIVIDKSFEEFEASAVNAKAECLLRLAELLSIAKQNEERAAQAERDRLRLAELEEESKRNREREAAERRQREQQEAEQRRQQQEQQAAAQRAEQLRQQQSQQAQAIVDQIRKVQRRSLTATSIGLLEMVTEIEAIQPGDELGDFVGIAMKAKDEALSDLHALHEVVVQREADKRAADEREAERVEAQRLEQVRLDAIAADLKRQADELAKQKRLAEEAARPAAPEVGVDATSNVQTETVTTVSDRTVEVVLVEPQPGETEVGIDPAATAVFENTAESAAVVLDEAEQQKLRLHNLVMAAVSVIKHATAINVVKGKPAAFSVPADTLGWLGAQLPNFKFGEGCYYAADGTLMNADGTRNIFSDVDE